MPLVETGGVCLGWCMRRAFPLFCAVLLSGCITYAPKPKQRPPFRAASCEENCVASARDCRAEAIDQGGSGFGVRAMANAARQGGMLEACQANRDDCLTVCTVRRRDADEAKAKAAQIFEEK